MKILVAVEDKVFGDAIVDFVSNHEWPHDSEIKIVHVVEPVFVNALSGYPSDLIANFEEERIRAAKSLILGLGTNIRTKLPNIGLREEVLNGRPKEVILDLAASWPADLIVVGSHGRSGIGQFFLGSVSMSILSAAPCSVMVVKLPKKTEKESEAAGKEVIKSC